MIRSTKMLSSSKRATEWRQTPHWLASMKTTKSFRRLRRRFSHPFSNANNGHSACKHFVTQQDLGGWKGVIVVAIWFDEVSKCVDSFQTKRARQATNKRIPPKIIFIYIMYRINTQIFFQNYSDHMEARWLKTDSNIISRRLLRHVRKRIRVVNNAAYKHLAKMIRTQKGFLDINAGYEPRK